MEGSRQFSAESWRVLSRISSLLALGSVLGLLRALSPNLSPKCFQSMPKRRPEGGEKGPRMPKRRPEGHLKASKNGQKTKLYFRIRNGHFTIKVWRLFCLILVACWGQISIIFRDVFGLRFLDDFLEASGCIFGVILLHFWEFILVTFSDFAKNGAPHESTANSSQIEGRAPGQATKKPSTNEEKTT